MCEKKETKKTKEQLTFEEYMENEDNDNLSEEDKLCMYDERQINKFLNRSIF